MVYRITKLTALILSFSTLSGCKLIDKYKADNIVEEIIENIIENETGYDIDLSYNTPEENNND